MQKTCTVDKGFYLRGIECAGFQYSQYTDAIAEEKYEENNKKVDHILQHISNHHHIRSCHLVCVQHLNEER